MNKWKLIRAFLVVIILLPVIPGCKGDPLVVWLEDLNETAKASNRGDVAQRCELCLSKWQNRTLDPEPILVRVVFGWVTGSGMHLLLDAYDEDKDVVGFGIREEYTNANGLKTVLTEEYPAFVHRVGAEVLPPRLCPVQIRDGEQRKDAQRWGEYVKGEGIDVNSLRAIERWTETLPPVWISNPEPNKVDVYVYVYDRAGHKSEPLRLAALPPRSAYKPTPEELFWRKVRMDRQRSVDRVP